MHSRPVLQLPSLLHPEGTICGRLSHAERLSHQAATHATIKGKPGRVLLMAGEGEVVCAEPILHCHQGERRVSQEVVTRTTAGQTDKWASAQRWASSTAGALRVEQTCPIVQVVPQKTSLPPPQGWEH